jgi:hypothetical protein
MKKNFPVPRLDRVVAVLDGSPKLENPYNVQNLRLQGYDYWMRYGYTTIQPKQTNFQAVYGLGWSQGVSQISTESLPTPKEEVVTIEGIGSPEVIRPYSRMVLNPVNTTTFAPTQIGTTTLTNGKWGFASYNDYIYAICPGADKLSPPKPTVYKHLIGETTGVNAWVPIQDSSYVNTTGGITNIIAQQPITRLWDATETSTMSVTATTGISGAYTFTNISGAVRLAANSVNAGGNQIGARVQCIFNGNVDVTKNDYIAVRIETVVGGAFYYLQNFYGVPNADKPVLRFNGVDQSPEYRLYVNEDGTELVIYMYVKGLLDRDKLQRVTFSVIASGADTASNIALFDIKPMELGGVYLNTTTTGKRLWDTFSLDGLDGSANGVNYATRYKTGGTYSTATIVNATKVQMSGFQLTPSPYYGGRVILSGTQNTSWTEIEFLRQQVGGTWKILATKLNSGTDFSVVDTYQENELTGLTTATGVTGTAPTPTPTFRTAGIVGAFPYKQSMVWLVNQTSKNIQLSRVGDPLELFDTARIYGETDNTVPGQYTLADDQADVPVWGTQAGVSAFIIGKYAAYAMVGDYPRAMSPSRQIPGSRGIVGCYAGTRFRNAEGIWGAAYADQDLNIWVVNSVPAFIEDASAKPQEISLPIRGKLKDFLYTQQKIEISNLDITNTKLVFEEEESSLWVMLGKRAAVFRQDMVGNGWELYDYTLSSDVTVATCTDFYTTGATASEHDNGTSWSNFGFPFASDDSYCTNTFALGAGANNYRTKYLTADGYLPSPLIPTNATITGVTYRLEDSKTGDLAVTNNHAHPSYNNTPLGSNLATSRVVITSDVTQDFAMVSLPTVAQLNSGLMGIDIRYESEEWLSAWLDPANYTVVITPTSPQVRVPADPIPYVTIYTVTVTYTAGGTKPPYAFVNLTGQTTIGGDVVPILGTGDTDNGLGGTNSGQIGTLAAVPPDPPTVYTVSTNTTVRQKVLLSSGVGTYQVTMTSDGTLATNKFQATHTLTGVFDSATLATVRVDNVAMKVCYTVTSPGVNVQWSQVNFSPNGKYLGFRSTGELDIIEKDFRTGIFIGGTNRDSGLAPSNWFFTTQAIQWDGSKARLASVQYHGQNYTDVVDVAVSVDDSAYVSGTLEGVVTSKWYKFHPSVSSGIRHNVKITGNESDATLKGYTLEFSVQSRGKPR